MPHSLDVQMCTFTIRLQNIMWVGKPILSCKNLSGEQLSLEQGPGHGAACTPVLLWHRPWMLPLYFLKLITLHLSHSTKWSCYWPYPVRLHYASVVITLLVISVITLSVLDTFVILSAIKVITLSVGITLSVIITLSVVTASTDLDWLTPIAMTPIRRPSSGACCHCRCYQSLTLHRVSRNWKTYCQRSLPPQQVRRSCFVTLSGNGSTS